MEARRMERLGTTPPSRRAAVYTQGDLDHSYRLRHAISVPPSPHEVHQNVRAAPRLVLDHSVLRLDGRAGPAAAVLRVSE